MRSLSKWLNYQMNRHICNILTSPVLIHVVGCSRCETGSESTRIACDERKQKLFRGNNAARFQEFKCFFFLLVKIKFNLLFVVCLLTKFNAIIIPRPFRTTTLVKVTVYPETEYDSVIHLPVLYTLLWPMQSCVVLSVFFGVATWYVTYWTSFWDEHDWLKCI